MHKLLMGTALTTACAAITMVAAQGAAVAQAPKQPGAGPAATCDQQGDRVISFAALTLPKPGAGSESGNCTSAVGSSY